MSAIDIALPRLETEEGFRATAYSDTGGHTTIGFGFNVDAGISEFAAGALLTAQLQELHRQLLALPWYAALDDVRQSVCLDIAFNAGLPGLLHFPRMIAALERQDWAAAATECQVQNPELAHRYADLAQILFTGVS
jgi:lysozyme